ncbi:hypothetical protein KCU90_g25096, partial [Aureobasidium melanogenum]
MRLRRQPQHQQPGTLKRKRSNRDTKPTVDLDRIGKQQARADKQRAENSQRQSRIGPMPCRIKQRNERRNRPKAGRAQRQPDPMRQHPREHAPVRHPLAMHNRHRRDKPRQIKPKPRQQNHQSAQRGEPDRMRNRNTQRRANRERAIRCNAVPRNHPSVVARAHPADPPQNRPRPAQTFAESEHQTAAHQQPEAQHRPAPTQHGQQQQNPTRATTQQADRHG